MPQDTNIQGLACDHASLEVSVDGSPIPEAFSSVDPKIDTEFEKIWLNGKANPSQRTLGKIDPSFDAEMPMKEYAMLCNRLGGQGADPNFPEYFTRTFQVQINFRPKNDPYMYMLRFKDCRIKSPSLSSAAGKAAMWKFTVDAMGVEGPVIE